LYWKDISRFIVAPASFPPDFVQTETLLLKVWIELERETPRLSSDREGRGRGGGEHKSAVLAYIGNFLKV